MFINRGIHLVGALLLCLPASAQSIGHSIGFSQSGFESSPFVEFHTPILIDPVPSPGIFSYGLICSLQGSNGLVGIVTMDPAADLGFDGPFGPGVRGINAETGLFSAKGSVDALAVGRPMHMAATLGSLTIAGLPEGNYTLRLASYNTLGPTETIFVDGLNRPLDPLLNFGTATLRVQSVSTPVPQASVTALGPIRADRQTGLLIRDYEVRNTGLVAAVFRVFIDNMPAQSVVWNRSGMIDGRAYIDLPASLAPGNTYKITIQYFSQDRTTIPKPNFVVTSAVPVVVKGVVPASALQPRATFTGGQVLLEFGSEKGKLYYIQYSSDMGIWKTALPKVTGTGSRIQWTDNGAPKTDSLPLESGCRFYRIVTALPAP